MHRASLANWLFLDFHIIKPLTCMFLQQNFCIQRLFPWFLADATRFTNFPIYKHTSKQFSNCYPLYLHRPPSEECISQWWNSCSLLLILKGCFLYNLLSQNFLPLFSIEPQSILGYWKRQHNALMFLELIYQVCCL